MANPTTDKQLVLNLGDTPLGDGMEIEDSNDVITNDDICENDILEEQIHRIQALFSCYDIHVFHQNRQTILGYKRIFFIPPIL